MLSEVFRSEAWFSKEVWRVRVSIELSYDDTRTTSIWHKNRNRTVKSTSDSNSSKISYKYFETKSNPARTRLVSNDQIVRWRCNQEPIFISEKTIRYWRCLWWNNTWTTTLWYRRIRDCVDTSAKDDDWDRTKTSYIQLKN